MTPDRAATSPRTALEAAERVKASAIENGGRLTPGAILDIQTAIDGLRAAQDAPAPEGLREGVEEILRNGSIYHDAGSITARLRELLAAPPTPAEPPRPTAYQEGWRDGTLDRLGLAEARPPEGLDATAIERLAREHFEPRRHFYEGDGKQDCQECGEGPDQDFLRVSVHFDDGDG